MKAAGKRRKGEAEKDLGPVCFQWTYREAKKLLMAFKKAQFAKLTPQQKQAVQDFLIDLGIEVEDRAP